VGEIAPDPSQQSGLHADFHLHTELVGMQASDTQVVGSKLPTS
jgi:hypothetical protein